MTTVARTIHDLRGSVPPHLVRRAIRQAEFMGLRLDGIETDRTRSDLERKFLRLCAQRGLPLPEVTSSSVAFEDDHARDLDLRGEGFAVHRFTERQLKEEPERVIEDVARALTKEDWLPKR